MVSFMPDRHTARLCARKRVYLCHDARERADISQAAVQTASTSWPESLAHLSATNPCQKYSYNELARMTDYYSSIFRHQFRYLESIDTIPPLFFR